MLHSLCNGLGEFGRVYKGTWIYKNASGIVMSEIVAVKTVKGMYVCNRVVTWACTSDLPDMYP